MNSFWQDAVDYAGEIRNFDRHDWIVYILWVGLMLGLFFSTAGFVMVGHLNGIEYPSYVWNVPIGTFIFIGAIAFDTIGHRTRYKEQLKKGEELVHHITIFAGITSCILLCLAYTFPIALRIPALSMIALSIFYSVIDEALHWHRYMIGQSDRVEMWSHFFIFLGHSIFILGWYQWFSEGYPGVAENIEVSLNLSLSLSMIVPGNGARASKIENLKLRMFISFELRTDDQPKTRNSAFTVGTRLCSTYPQSKDLQCLRLNLIN